MKPISQNFRIIPHHAWNIPHPFKILYPSGPGRGQEPQRDANGKVMLFNTRGAALNFLIQNKKIDPMTIGLLDDIQPEGLIS